MSTYVAQIITPSATYSFPYDGSHQWEVYSGYEPKVQPWVVPKEVADAVRLDLLGLVAPANEVTLKFGEVGSLQQVLRVIYLGMAPADDPQKRLVLFSDVRWYLTYAIMCTDINVRRRVGNTRLLGGSLVAATVVPTIAYGAWSLNSGAAYDWASYKTQALNYLTTHTHGRPAISWTTDSFTMATVSAQVCQESTTDSDGPSALAKAIEAVPGAGIYTDFSGILHVHERTGGAEAYYVSQLSPELMDHGDLVFVSMEQSRPNPSAHAWRVYVDLEVEVRLDYNVSGTFTTNYPYLVPVLQVTDPSLVIPAGTYMLGTRSGSATDRTVGQGSWIGQDEAFAAWGSKTVAGVVLPQLTDTIVANHWAGDGLTQYGCSGALGSFDPLWAARIGELIRRWRTSFMVNPQFWGLVRHAWNVRAAVWDPVTGARAPSPVYCNYHVSPIDPNFKSDEVLFGRNVTTSYPSTPSDLSTGNPSGFQVQIEDEELGVVTLIRDISRFAGSNEVFPSPCVDVAGISDDDTALKEHCLQKLVPATSWKMAMVLSLAPASPNDLRRLYEIQVSMSQASTTAGLVTPTTTGAAPDQELRSLLAQARIPWVDATGASNLAMFGEPDTTPDISNQNPISAVDPVNLDQELKPLAYALAAEDLMGKQDHWEGSLVVPASTTTKNLVPRGSIDRVIHKVMDDAFVTVIHCTPRQKPFNAIDLIPGSARSYLLKQIQGVR